MEDVENASLAMNDFCNRHHLNRKQANHLALFIEEMGSNIIFHGVRQAKYQVSAELRVNISENVISLTFRDYCKSFDPTKYYEIHKDEDPSHNIGIRIIMNMAKEVQYVSAFNSNNVIISLDREG